MTIKFISIIVAPPSLLQHSPRYYSFFSLALFLSMPANSSSCIRSNANESPVNACCMVVCEADIYSWAMSMYRTLWTQRTQMPCTIQKNLYRVVVIEMSDVNGFESFPAIRTAQRQPTAKKKKKNEKLSRFCCSTKTQAPRSTRMRLQTQQTQRHAYFISTFHVKPNANTPPETRVSVNKWNGSCLVFEVLFASFAYMAAIHRLMHMQFARKVAADWRVCNMHSAPNANEQPNHIRSSATWSRTFPPAIAQPNSLLMNVNAPILYQHHYFYIHRFVQQRRHAMRTRASFWSDFSHLSFSGEQKFGITVLHVDCASRLPPDLKIVIYFSVGVNSIIL